MPANNSKWRRDGISCFLLPWLLRWRGHNPFPFGVGQLAKASTSRFQSGYIESFFTQPDKPKQQPLAATARSSSLYKTLHHKPNAAANGYVSRLKNLSRRKAIVEGRHVHAKIKDCAQDSHPCVGNALIQMYGNCGSIKDAHAAFDKISQPNLHSWTALIKAYGCNGSLHGALAIFNKMPEQDVVAWTAVMASYTQHREGEQALLLFYQMIAEGCIMPDVFAFTCALDACSMTNSLEIGRLIHATMVGFSSNLHLVAATALITLYGNCGSFLDAKSIFEKTSHRDVVCWNAMIATCVYNEHNKDALLLFHQMQLEGDLGNNVTYVHVLNACANLSALEKGRTIHLAILDGCLDQQTVTITAVINMYGRCKSICSARKAFALLTNHDVVSWTSMVVALTQNGEFQEALDFFYQMQLKNVKADGISYARALDACGELAATAAGMELHVAVNCSEHAGDPQVGNALFNMYIKCGCFWEAKKVFSMLSFWDESTWNLMIGALIDHGHHRDALCLFFQLCHKNLKPSDLTYTRIVNVCTDLLATVEGSMVHAVIVENGDDHKILNGTLLVNMYGKCGRVCDAKNVFENMSNSDVVAWNAMGGALVHNGSFQDALYLFHQAMFLNIELSEVSFLYGVEACTGLSSLEDGHGIHATIAHMHSGLDVIVGTALINMYGKCGCLSDAKNILQSLSCQDVVAFTAMISAFVQNGSCEEALQTFFYMLGRALNPDSITAVCAVEACCTVKALELGHKVHMISVEIGYEHELVLGTSFVEMYGSCGSVEDANKAFKMLPHGDIGSWNAMLAVFARNGNGMAAKELLCQLQQLEVIPDCTTFISILSALSHEGMMNDGWYLLSTMKKYFRFILRVDHHICMVDLLGRAGQLHTAEALVNFMPFQGAFAWRCLLGTCKLHGNLAFGEQVAKFCFEQYADIDAPYVMLANLYAAVGEDDAPNVSNFDDEWHECDMLGMQCG